MIAHGCDSASKRATSSLFVVEEVKVCAGCSDVYRVYADLHKGTIIKCLHQHSAVASSTSCSYLPSVSSSSIDAQYMY